MFTEEIQTRTDIISIVGRANIFYLHRNIARSYYFTRNELKYFSDTCTTIFVMIKNLKSRFQWKILSATYGCSKRLQSPVN